MASDPARVGSRACLPVGRFESRFPLHAFCISQTIPNTVVGWKNAIRIMYQEERKRSPYEDGVRADGKPLCSKTVEIRMRHYSQLDA